MLVPVDRKSVSKFNSGSALVVFRFEQTHLRLQQNVTLHFNKIQGINSYVCIHMLNA